LAKILDLSRYKTSWCEVCQYEAKSDNFEELMKLWTKHTESSDHLRNVIKYLQYDLGALTIDEIPKKLDKLLEGNNG